MGGGTTSVAFLLRTTEGDRSLARGAGVEVQRGFWRQLVGVFTERRFAATV